MKLKFFNWVLIAFCITTTFTSCDKDRIDDWNEVIRLYVDAELGKYQPWGHPMDTEPLDGLKIKEQKDADWIIIPINGIEGFTHSLGWEYYLEVKKKHLVPPPTDASNIKYKLIKIIKEQKVKDLEFPTLEVKGAFANSYTANIFEPVHFYLHGNEYMQQDLSKLCDSLVFETPWLKGTHLSRKIYSNEVSKSELIYSWEHRFILPLNGICYIKAYKDGKLVYNDGISISLSNNKDFLMYNWDEVTDNSNSPIGYINFVDKNHEFMSTHYIIDKTPIVKASLNKLENVTSDWLYEYLCRLYKKPLYTTESGVQEQYSKLFTDTDMMEIPLYIWQTDRSRIALIRWYDSKEDITKFYIKAEPVRGITY